MKYFYIKRITNGQDLGTVDIPERDLEATLKRNPDWKVVSSAEPELSASLNVPQEIPKIECPICGKEFKNEGGLRLHKRVHQ